MIDFEQYLRHVSYKNIKTPFGISSQDSLDILSKSLLYNSYQHLVDYYTLDEDGTPLGFYEEEEIEIPLPDLRAGFFFSEFTLQQELGVDLREAYSIKRRIDHYFSKEKSPLFGDYWFTNLNLTGQHSFMIKEGERFRMMFSYPIQFYCIMRDQLFYNRSGEVYDIEALWCDAIDFQNYHYFQQHSHLLLYIRYIIEDLIHYNDLVICDVMVRYLRKKLPFILHFIEDKFEHHYVSSSEKEYVSYGLLIPSDLTRDQNMRNKRKDSILNLPIDNKKWTYSSKLKYYMTSKNITQKTLCKKSGVTDRSIRNILNKPGHQPNTHTVEALSKALGIYCGEFYQDIE